MRLTVAMNAGADDAGLAPSSTAREYEARRAEALSTEELSIPPEYADRPYRIVIEATALGGRWTLIAFATGESRLLLSNGPDIIARATDAAAKVKAMDLVEAAGSCRRLVRPEAVLSAPKMGETGFHLLTGQGLFGAVEKTSVLHNGESPLSPLLESSDDLVSRLLQNGLDRRKKPEPKPAGLAMPLALFAGTAALIYAASFIQSPVLRWTAIAIAVSLAMLLLIPRVASMTPSPDDD